MRSLKFQRTGMSAAHTQQYYVFVRATKEYGKIIPTLEHPDMAGCATEVQAVLDSPEEIRRRKSDANVYLSYRSR
jgi:hypothetical protein